MKKLPHPNPTARELLEHVAGEAHALCSVVKYQSFVGHLTLHCSCGEVFRAALTPEAKGALKNVPEVA